VWGGGGDVFPPELIATFRRLAARRVLGIRVKPFFIVGYGMAEVAGPMSLAFPAPRGEGCLGWMLPGLEWKVVDERGHEVRRGEVGELVVRGPTVMIGYWQSPEFTASVLRNGWFHTGDLVRRGRLGLLHMVSREKEVIKFGGYRVFPAEVERQLAAHPQIEDVAVVGIPHEVAGEIPVAAVVPKTGQTIDQGEMLAWTRARMASYKCPRRIAVVDAIPLSAVFKPKRTTIREILCARFRQEQQQSA
jgi:acyl-CoA synthetase (AMP-forming)/AMP-acid ligase II